MHTLNSSKLLAWCTLLCTIAFLSCATQKIIPQASTCYSEGILVVTKLNSWNEQEVKVSNSLVAFNHYASLFADTISQITGAPIDSLILFTLEEDTLDIHIKQSGNRHVKHSLFLSLQRDEYYFIEQVSNYTQENRPNFGTGKVHLLRCTDGDINVIFSKAVDYN